MIQISAEADDPKAGMTLDELAEFVEQARQHGTPDDTRPRVRVTMRGGIRRIETR